MPADKPTPRPKYETTINGPVNVLNQEGTVYYFDQPPGKITRPETQVLTDFLNFLLSLPAGAAALGARHSLPIEPAARLKSLAGTAIEIGVTLPSELASELRQICDDKGLPTTWLNAR